LAYGSWGLCAETVFGLVFSVDLLSDVVHLASLQLADPDRPPAFGGADRDAEHELEDGPVADGVRDDLEPPALLDKQAFKEVDGSDCAAVGDRHAQVRDAGLEVVHEAGGGTGELGFVVCNHIRSEVAGDGA